MSQHLTSGQRALLEAELVRRQHQFDAQLAAHHGGLSRAEHASVVLAQDGDDAPQREGEREIDLALSDRVIQELGSVSSAIRRVHADGFGLCADCGAEIPFDRLKAEPWATRCVACESAHEEAAGRPH
jgi:DnaK suppressor protein